MLAGMQDRPTFHCVLRVEGFGFGGSYGLKVV